MKLALGTVQFGMRYGIANQTGQVSRKEVGNMLALARKGGIDMLDTAIAYGDSEACLGNLGMEGFSVVTKLPSLPEGIRDIEAWVDEQIHASLARLKVNSVYGLLLHRSADLLGPEGQAVLEAMKSLKRQGIAKKIGISIYNPKELDAVSKACVVDLVQAPFNVLDRRLETSGWLERLHDQGVEIHVRSAFLQGLLLMSRSAIPLQFEGWAHLWDVWREWLEEKNVTATEACLGFISSYDNIDRLVVGADSGSQLEGILVTAAEEQINQSPNLVCDDEDLLNPSNWEHNISQ